MKTIVYLLILMFSFSCTPEPEHFIKHLNGYWEIESVELANGIKKDYKINTTVDYIEIGDSLRGFRKKMQPRLDGTYKTSQDAEGFQLKLENDSLNIYYTTPFNSWKETILYADSTALKIANQNKDVYLYKRFIPIQID